MDALCFIRSHGKEAVSKVATKLKHLRIKKVDFVDEGANPDAHIRMLKRKDGGGQPAEGDSKKEPGNIMKKLLGFIGRAAGMNQDEIESAVDEIQKGDSVSFSEKINEVNNQKIADEIWDTCYALQSSLCSILNDEELDSDSAATAMKESLDEFCAVVQESIREWSSGRECGIVRKAGEVSETDLQAMKSAVGRLNKSIENACGAGRLAGETQGAELKPGNLKKVKGDEKEMKIDKSRMTDAEKAFLESIEKRYGIADEAALGGGSADEPVTTPMQQNSNEPAVTKSVAQPVTEPAPQTDESDNIYKGLHPAVKAELESLKKFREDALDRELGQVAKKYEIIGKKPEELVPLFKTLKAAGGTAYDDMVAVLDQTVETVEKSGAFSEIGKSGHGFGTAGAVEAKVDTIAKGYMEKDPSMDYTTAVAKAWEDHPELMGEYEEEAGF